MGIYLGQLPPAELARLKAELAETLIANFCYPRFFDYRTDALHMRPVDRAKRQEVWIFLSSYDFTSWSRVDILSLDFQSLVERLLIQFVQRNRSFFGEQGRKRMADVRALITTSSSAVTDGLRIHLTGRRGNTSTFGSPRPVVSWANTRVSGRAEPTWEQIANATLLLQQQLQESRGEVWATQNSETRQPLNTPANGVLANGAAPGGQGASSPLAKRSPRSRAGLTGSGKLEAARSLSRPVPPPVSPSQQGELRVTNPLPGQKATNPLEVSAPITSSVPLTQEQRTQSEPVIEREESSAFPASTRERQPDQSFQGAPALREAPPLTPFSSSAPVASSGVAPSRELARQDAPAMVEAAASNGATVLVGDEDVVIFEQMRHQLIVWLRIETVRLGIEISGQSPTQLMEMLRQQDNSDESRLQVVATLLNLANQVITNGHATLVEYKQAMMFYLMHTRRAR